MARPSKPIDTTTFSGRIAAEVRRRRERKKLTVQEAAARADVPASTWYTWEQGRHLALDCLPRIAAALGCQERDLVPKREKSEVRNTKLETKKEITNQKARNV